MSKQRNTKEISNVIPLEIIENKIYLVRGYKIMLDSDLAKLYGVPTHRLNEQVKRNVERFPGDFMFRLNKEEVESLRSQIASSKISRGGRRYLPFVFTQEGVAMLSGVLNSPRAIAVNVQIMRVFVRLRNILASHKDLAYKLSEFEKKYDGQFKVVFEAIRRLMTEDKKSNTSIGFHAK